MLNMTIDDCTSKEIYTSSMGSPTLKFSHDLKLGEYAGIGQKLVPRFLYQRSSTKEVPSCSASLRVRKGAFLDSFCGRVEDIGDALLQLL